MDPKQNWRAPYLIEPGPAIRTRTTTYWPQIKAHVWFPVTSVFPERLKPYCIRLSAVRAKALKRIHIERYSKTFRINSISYKIDSETPSANKDGTTVWSLNPISSKKKVWTLACPFLGNIIQGKVAYKELFILRQESYK